MSNDLILPTEQDFVRSGAVEGKSTSTSTTQQTAHCTFFPASLMSGIDVLMDRAYYPYTNNTIAASGATQSAQDAPGLPADDEAWYSTTESPEVPNKKRGLLRVPSRSSSQKIQPSPTSTGLSGATVSDPTDSIGGRSKESKSSIMGRRRNGSTASSKRSGTSPEAMQASIGNTTAVHAQPPPAQKPRKSRGFLAFLNCCSVPDNANGVDSDEPPLPMKVSKLSQTTQLTSSKPDPSTVPASVRSTVPVTEKEDLKQTEQVLQSVPDQNESSKVPPRGRQENPQAALERKVSAKDVRNQPLPPVPQDVEKLPKDQETALSPSVAVVTTTSGPSQPDDAPSAESQAQSQDTSSPDTPMPDAPSPPVEERKATSTDQPELNSTVLPLPLPLPPPVPIPEPVKPLTSLPENSTVAPPAEEKQQWLLPPIEARFKGKKCLVLDLDETLVHSSFKVRFYSTSFWH
jgi:carboxy-terminal domain RNA polymerase II polypeptide A small phosphatase